jgi:hypothetical protein
MRSEYEECTSIQYLISSTNDVNAPPMKKGKNLKVQY